MNKIVLTVFILVFSTFYPVHAETLNGIATDKLWMTGTVLDSWSEADRKARYTIIQTKKKIWYCRREIWGNYAKNFCHTAMN